jgi:predicted dehydrogenase
MQQRANILRGAVIGCGAIAREHLAAVAMLNNVEIAAVCDLSAARAQATAERFGVGCWYTNCQQLIDDVRPDLVHITSSPASHFEIALTCLSNGLNVLCEKPITVKYEEFRHLMQLALDQKCFLMENQNFRFHSGIQRIQHLINSDALGEVLDAQICLSLKLYGSRSPYTDLNQPHSSSLLRGGVIGDFLPHLAYLAYMFIGSIRDLRTTWIKQIAGSPLAFDEFRCLIHGERATAYVSFSGNSQPDGFWVRVAGTRAHVETNLFEPPRFTMRRLRAGEPALMRFLDGVAEGCDVMTGTMGAFWRKLAGTSSYDGLPELIARTYRALEKNEPQPLSLKEIDIVAHLVDRFTALELMI